MKSLKKKKSLESKHPVSFIELYMMSRANPCNSFGWWPLWDYALIEPSTFFPKFWWGSLRKKFGVTAGKSHLNIKQNKTCQVWKWYVLSEQRYNSQKLWNFTDICMVGSTNLPATKQTIITFHNFADRAISLLVFNKSFSKLAI